MTAGVRYLPSRRRGARRLGVIGLGVMALMSLVWQQQATLASFTDKENAAATFTAGTLSVITPDLTSTAATVTATWTPTTRNWVTPAYVLSGATSSGGANALSVYGGPGVSDGAGRFRALDSDGWGSQTTRKLDFTAVAAGEAHACGIALGTVYCWGTSASGGLGLGSTIQAPVPTAVTGGDLAGKTAIAITAGTDFTCALAEGKVYCWGKGNSGQLGNGGQSSQATPKVVSSLTSVTSISAGTAHACALVGVASTPFCWGQGSSGQLGDNGGSQKESPVAVKVDGALAGRTVASISAGGAHTCAVADGMAYCWGANGSGQLGDGTTSSRSTPTAVDTTNLLAGRTVSMVSAGGTHTCAIADAKAYCWGEGASRQLGNGGTGDSAAPALVSGSATVTSVSSGATGTCALNAGAVSCWGFGNWAVPTAIAGPSGRSVTGLSIGSDFGCAVAENAPAACAGNAASYQLGNNSTAGPTTAFADVSLSGPACPDKSVRISSTACSLVQGTGYYYQLGYKVGAWTAPDSGWLKATTTVRPGVELSAGARTGTSITVAWTAAQEPGQAYPEYLLERSPNSDGSNATTVAITGAQGWTDGGGVAPARSFTTLATGEAHTCGIVGDDLYCWGQNQYGQLGIGTTVGKSVPTKVDFSGKKVSAVSAGQFHTCAIADSKVYCWGSDGSGQLGDGAGSGGTKTTPTAVSGLSGTPKVISAGTSHTCAVSGDAAYCWGLNNDGQLGNSSTTSSATAVVVNTGGEMGTQKVVAIAAGGAHTCAIGADSRVYCWGQNAFYQLGGRQGSTVDRTTSVAVETGSGAMGTQAVTAITAGSSHSCAIAASKAYCWGLATSGQVGNNSTTTARYTQAVSTITAVTRLTAGANHTCGVASGLAYCWGANAAGQLGNGGLTNSSVPVAVTARGALGGATITAVAAGTSHGCLVANSDAYCWGSGSDGRLGNRTTVSSGTAVKVLADPRCASGSLGLGDSRCSLASGATYYYRVTYTLDGNTTTSSGWTALSPS